MSNMLDLPETILERLPQSELCATALSLAQRTLGPAILHHSVRVFLHAKWLSEKENSGWTTEDKLPLLFMSTICHDFGASELFNGTQRFEIEGADAAKNHLLRYGSSSADSHQVWVAIALHTSAGIAQRIDPLARLVQNAVKLDFSPPEYRDQLGATEHCATVEHLLPRLNIENVLCDTVINQAGKIPSNVTGLGLHHQKHPAASWPGIVLRAHIDNPDHKGINPAFYAFD